MWERLPQDRADTQLLLLCVWGEQLLAAARVLKRSCSALGLCSTCSGIGIVDVQIRRWELHEEW